ncbi:hypothetical protein psal_cds_185 [Pandoravirus salinus]|uniref:Uncharacterized protein n=1 Tax=Pandoravirus salinus TaxID=1349410 RepID=S4VT94_9VIRU|nr:hypothetical protein psal_cds_185 [Pandoravirus salinus]AGO83684.2 hypothetical protein psal_cds_185 [Pandoravirus salinus]
MDSEKANDLWLYEGAPQRVWIVSWPGVSRRATKAIGRDSVCLTPDAVGRKTVRSALLLSARAHRDRDVPPARRSQRGLPPGYTELDDIDGASDDDGDDGKSDATDHGASDDGDNVGARWCACDHMIDLKDSITSASRIRLWCATMAPGETFTFGWLGESACEGTGRVECRAAFGKRREGRTLNGGTDPVTIVTYIALAVLAFCFFRLLFGRRT